MDELPELMTIADFRKRFSISNTQTYREVNAGRLQLTKIGSASRVSREHALEWKKNLAVIKGDVG